MYHELRKRGTRPRVTVRRYRADDEEAAVAVWQHSWQAAYPDIDFTARLAWWRTRWRDELVPVAIIAVAELDDALAGFVTVDVTTGYLDQLVVAPDLWGGPVAAMLMEEAKRLSPTGLDLHVNQDNTRAIRFYEKQGFVIAATDANPLSGRPTWRMKWRPQCS